MAGINLDPHDEFTLPAGENLEGKQYFLVTITAAGTIKLAKEGEPAFVLLNEPASGDSASVAGPLQVKAVAGEELSPGWKLKVNNEGKLVKATEEKHVVGICTSPAKVPSGAIAQFCSSPAGCTG